MRTVAPVLLALLSGAAPTSPSASAPAAVPSLSGSAVPPGPDAFDPMNRYREDRGCHSIPQQVAGADRRYDGTRLDRQPPGRLLLAVDREVNGCHQATLIRRSGEGR